MWSARLGALVLLSVLAAVVSSPVAESPDSAAPAAAADGAQDPSSVETTATAPAEKQDPAARQSTTNSETFFVYGASIMSAIYGLMGISYLYGPYSKQATAARLRSQRRRDYLEQFLQRDAEAEAELQYRASAQTGALQPEGYAAGVGSWQPSAAAGEGEYQLVMARDGAVPPAAGGVNRIGPQRQDFIPIRLPTAGPARLRGSGAPGDTVVKVLDMSSGECRAWVDCLQRRAQSRAADDQSSAAPAEAEDCETFFFTCPTVARKLRHVVAVPPAPAP